MKKVFSVDSIKLALNKSNPPCLVVTAEGTANTSGWSGFTLRPLWNRSNPPVNGVYSFALEGVPPTGIVQQVLTPTGPVSHTLTYGETKDVRKVVVYAASNSQSVEYNEKNATDSLLSASPDAITQTGVGYSDNWDLADAFRDAIKNLPTDPYPYPDKLQQYRIVSIEAEVGGFVGLNRMKVTIEA
ncbi:MAG TPA: hypothetical protein PKG90_07200 [Chitinophagaceae bacterium]|nr:hypothetical protein [Chitinophagaceae bacterium]HNU13482.1 hypothetical protein [Chitinophagaceae bacterium]